jgi:hypothetical protein
MRPWEAGAFGVEAVMLAIRSWDFDRRQEPMRRPWRIGFPLSSGARA